MSGGVYHGGGLDAAIAEFGGVRKDWLDLSTGINPNGWPVGTVARESWARLPDRAAMDALLAAARQFYGTGKAEIVAVPGTQALLEILPQIIGAGTVAIVSPTYGEHEHVWRKAGAQVHTVEEPDAGGCEALVVVNPNNPDGRIWPAEMLIAEADKLARRSGWLIVDEAFADAQPAMSLLDAGPLPANVIVLKSLGKFFGLAGLRLGFAIGAEGPCKAIGQRLGPWAVSGPALEVGAAALSDTGWIDQTRERLAIESGKLASVLSEAGLSIIGENPLFVFAGHENAYGVFRELASRHVLVRPFPELPGKLRFGLPGTEADFQRLERELADVTGRT
jgi:cobalamin biosynthetic protein CobC